MTSSHTPLGDSHNFGRRVSLHEDRVFKPRTVVWEWLMLARDSPLRRCLDDAAFRDGLGREVFGFLPQLEFSRSEGREGGEVERVKLDPLSMLKEDGTLQLAQIAGRSVALWSWLGVSDLHWENLVLGVDRRGAIVFAPLDIEMILADLTLPTETKLLPDADVEYAATCRHACGVRRVLPYLGKPIGAPELLSMAGAYLRTLAFLDRHAAEIAEVFKGLPGLRETPIRVCLRGTDEYVRARAESLWPPLLGAEAEQLARGDIPYFFRLYGRPGIHYYGDQALTQVKTLPLDGDVPQLDAILRLSRGLRSPSRKKLREDGLFTLLGAFDHRGLMGRHKNDNLEVTFATRTLIAKPRNGDELHSRRDLSPFVGSVYLRCRCGEVRTVFVPSVTICEIEGGAAP